MARNWLLLAAKFAVSAGVIAFLAFRLDLAAAEDRWRLVSVGVFGLAVGLVFLQGLVMAARWRCVLALIAAPLAFARAVRIVLASLFLAQILPSTVGGDAARMWLAARNGLSPGDAVKSVALERIGHLLGLALLVVASQPLLWTRIPEIPSGWILVGLGGAVALGAFLAMQADRIPPSVARGRLGSWLAAFGRDTRRLFLGPWPAVQQLGLSVTGHGLMAGAVFALASGMGLRVSLFDCLLLVPPVLLIGSIPVSIAGWGVREAAMIAAFAFVGVAADDGFALSVLFGLAIAASRLPGGAAWILGADRREVLRAAVGAVPGWQGLPPRPAAGSGHRARPL